MVTVDLRTQTPQQFAAVIAGKLAALAASAAPADAGGRARGARPARPAGAVRVAEADPRRLGVHAAISVPGVPGEVLPEYVRRDVDAGVRAKVTAADERGGFVLLVGGSSVGKTRSAVEAVKELLPDWWLVHPAGSAEVAALAAAPPPRTVVWLDELQRYLDGEHGLTGGVVRALLNAPHPAVIIGTMWPDFYAVHTAMPTSRGVDPHSREREVLDLAVVVRIGVAFSPAEQDRARVAAVRDPRLRAALDAAGYGLTQTLAAAPMINVVKNSIKRAGVSRTSRRNGIGLRSLRLPWRTCLKQESEMYQGCGNTSLTHRRDVGIHKRHPLRRGTAEVVVFLS